MPAPSSPSSLARSARALGTLLAILCCLTPGGCSATSIEDLPPELQTASVVSTRGPGAPLGPSGVWAFLPDSRILARPDNTQAAWVEQMVRDALISGMSERGWTLTGVAGAQVQLGYVIAVDDELDDAAIAATFGLNPGLPTSTSRHGKGTLVVELRRPGAPMALWRGSVQILADPTLSKDLRTQRIRNGVASVLRGVPVEG